MTVKEARIRSDLNRSLFIVGAGTRAALLARSQLRKPPIHQEATSGWLGKLTLSPVRAVISKDFRLSMAASSRDDHSVIIFLFLLIVDLITPLRASNLEIQDVVEACEDIQDKEQDVEAQVNCPLVLSNDGRTVGLQDTFGTSLSSAAVASTNAKEADNEAKENIDRGHVVEPDHVDFDKCREKVER